MSKDLAWRLTLADDHPVMLRGLKTLIEGTRELRVVATASDGVAAEEDIRRLLPDVAVLDVHMPKRNGVEVLRSLVRDRIRTRIVLLTASLSEGLLVDAVRLGAQGIAIKDAEPETIIECLTQVAHGNRWLDANLARRMEEAVDAGVGAHPTHALTPREAEIMELVAQGNANKSIAERIAVSEGTVKIHLHNIYQKLGVANRTELAALSLSRRSTA